MLIEDFEAYAEAVAALPEPQRSLPAEKIRDWICACETARDNAHDPEVTAADYFPHCF
jgi:hypothetical protein